jgi:GT2 family glycosyltransferase
MLDDAGWLARADLTLVPLPDNTGGAGGFAAGMAHAATTGADWIWVMDDDAIPHPDALAELTAVELDPINLYGSVAVCGDRVSWPMTPLGMRGRVYQIEALPALSNVTFIPFLGLLVSRAMVARIGLPDARFFIAADDVDYCMRARRAGAGIMLVAGSRIEHPASDADRLCLPWGEFHTLRLPAWKRYYDVRNRIFVARNHYGLALYYKTIPGLLLRLATSLLHQPDRHGQIRAFVAGMTDGLLGRSGRRHEAWGIKP